MLTCEVCGKECKTAQGLSGHRRLKHSVVSGGSSGGDRSDQGSVSGGDRSGEWSGDQSAVGAGVVAGAGAVGAGVVGGDQSSEAFGEQSGESWAEWKILSIVREHHDTGVWDPDFLELVEDVVDPGQGELSVRGKAALRGFGKAQDWDRLSQGSS